MRGVTGPITAAQTMREAQAIAPQGRPKKDQEKPFENRIIQ
jgi:hypothetical protein